MFKVIKKEIEVAGKKISLETGKIARQADGAIIAQCGETVVLATAVGAKKVNPEVDYFPLSVNYQEKKYYAAGKIPGGYFKREARPTESETLISRLIDRPIRPLFPDEFKNEVQVLPTVISYDKENEAGYFIYNCFISSLSDLRNAFFRSCRSVESWFCRWKICFKSI